MAEVQWTPEQQAAIEGRGGSILVTAAAGSGKTAVLVERVVRQITRENNPIDADKLLVATFSNAAAAEMKRRISKKLWEMARENPDNSRLARQQVLLESAQISTIHSFCISLLRSYFQELSLPASFRIAEEQELNVLRMQTVKQVLETQYAQGDESFFDLVELISNTRSDDNLERTVLQLYDFVRNHPFYHSWLDRMEAQYLYEQGIDGTPWAQILLDYAKDEVAYCNDCMRLIRELAAGDEAMLAAYAPTFDADETIIERCTSALKTGKWEKCRMAFEQADMAPLKRLMKYPDEAKKELVKNYRNAIKKKILALRDTIFSLSDQQYIEDNKKLYPIITRLFFIVKEFDAAIGEVKLEHNLLDFGDLEHYTLSLLYDKKGDGVQRSNVAHQLSLQYEEILIDEYQDTNETQEMIFSAISRDGANLFMVGDVKQSIYRFRQARPEIFLAKKSSYAAYDGKIFPSKIALNANFRTRKQTTGLINYLFTMLMNPTIGEMYYEAEDRLEARAAYEECTDCAVHFTVVDTDSDMQRTESLSAEAHWVASKISQLLQNGTMIQGKTGMRPLEPGDICILLRSPKSRAGVFEQCLKELDIGCWSDRAGGFLEASEIAAIISFLRLITNPLLDLELAKVLRSPLYGFSSDDLGILRSKGKRKNLFVQLKMQAELGNELCIGFLKDYEHVRKLSVTAPVDEVLLEIYHLTGVLHKVQAMTGGDEKRANLQLLSEYAASYRQSSGGAVDGFVTYLSALEEYGYDLPSASVAKQNSVSIMSVHKSKGLEFPVVFFCDTAAKFNMMDLNANTLLHPDLGFACVLRDNRRLCQHKTLQYWAMRIENKRAMLSEELRILYVALTRAKEHLYITASDKELKLLNESVSKPIENGVLSTWTTRSANSFYDWLSAALVHHPDFDRQLLEQPVKVISGEGELQVITVKANSITEQKEEDLQQEEAEMLPDLKLVERLAQKLGYQYPYMEDTTTPTKISVSQLTHKVQEKEYFFARRPKVLLGQKLTPTERGIAAHKFMQFASFAAAAANPEAEIERLCKDGFISSSEATNIDRNTIATLFQSEVGRRILSADYIYREIRFLKEFTPKELSCIDPEFKVAAPTVVQGIADCVFVENGVGTIVDYKTDLVKEEETLRQRYSSQLKLYKAILQEHLNIEISEMLLYSFALNRQIVVK